VISIWDSGIRYQTTLIANPTPEVAAASLHLENYMDAFCATARVGVKSAVEMCAGLLARNAISPSACIRASPRPPGKKGVIASIGPDRVACNVWRAVAAQHVFLG
jgi:hypothetical protein